MRTFWPINTFDWISSFVCIITGLLNEVLVMFQKRYLALNFTSAHPQEGWMIDSWGEWERADRHDIPLFPYILFIYLFVTYSLK